MVRAVVTSLLLAASALCAAQTGNVTLYGRLNMNYEAVTSEAAFGRDVSYVLGTSPPDHTVSRVVSAQRLSGGSLYGVWGEGAAPPLGGGLAAIFALEFQSNAVVATGDTRIDVGTLGTSPPYAAAINLSSLSLGKQASYTFSPPNASQEATDVRLSKASLYGLPRIGALVASVRNNGNGCHDPYVTAFQINEDLAPQVVSDWNFGIVKVAPCYQQVLRLEVGGWEASSVVVGARAREGAGGVEQAALLRLRYEIPPPPPPPAASAPIPKAGAADSPPALSIDASFGGDGEVVIRAADPSVPLRYWHHTIDAQDRVLVTYALGRQDGSWSPALLRLKADGSADPTFASGGVVVIPTTGLSANPRTVTVDIHGNVVVTGETYTATGVRPFVYFHLLTSAPGAPETYLPKHVEHAIPGKENSAYFRHIHEPDGTITAVGATYHAYPDTSTMRPLLVQVEGPPAAVRAIEYFHANFGHYATIVDPVEAGKLDSGEISGWTRTKRFFWVYPLGTAGTAVIDRFFSTNFAKSSHVYTASAAESAAIKQNKDWLFEGPVFGAILPVMGKCPGALRPVTRIYNNGVTGSPNHQTTDDPAAIAEALARGGVLEGAGPAAAVYCTE